MGNTVNQAQQAVYVLAVCALLSYTAAAVIDEAR
jgi:hypothetical protein